MASVDFGMIENYRGQLDHGQRVSNLDPLEESVIGDHCNRLENSWKSEPDTECTSMMDSLVAILMVHDVQPVTGVQVVSVVVAVGKNFSCFQQHRQSDPIPVSFVYWY